MWTHPHFLLSRVFRQMPDAQEVTKTRSDGLTGSTSGELDTSVIALQPTGDTAAGSSSSSSNRHQHTLSLRCVTETQDGPCPVRLTAMSQPQRPQPVRRPLAKLLCSICRLQQSRAPSFVWSTPDELQHLVVVGSDVKQTGHFSHFSSSPSFNMTSPFLAMEAALSRLILNHTGLCTIRLDLVWQPRSH